MNIQFNFDFNGWVENFILLSRQDPLTISLKLFFGGGWIFFVVLFMYGVYHVWLEHRQGAYMSRWKYVLLAVDIPKNNEQTPKAVESVFVALYGSQSGFNLIEQYWLGKMRESFSFEIVSLEGYIQFLIRTPVPYRDLIEAAIYANYPEAEITEVEDYTKDFARLRFPNEEYNLWGSELLLVKDFPFPIRTYPDFEHTMTQKLVDPLANVLEALGHLGSGEQGWIQLITTPQAAPSWGELGKKVVKEFMGEKYKMPSPGSLDLIEKPLGWLSSGAIKIADFALGASGEEAKKEDADQWKMFKITPHERTVLEKVQNKLAKYPFRLKFRYVYLAKKEVFNKAKGVAMVLGAIQQFNTADGNGLKPGKRSKTSADYFYTKKRVAKKQNTILRYYIRRNNWNGDDTHNMYFSSEELASLWHFPDINIQTPLLEKIGSRTGAPPTRLPYESLTAKVETSLASAEELATALGFEPRKTSAIRLPEVDLGLSSAIKNMPKAETAEPISPAEKKEVSAPRRRSSPPPNLPTV